MSIILVLFTTFDYSINANLHFVYDDNIFEYSKKYLEEFINRINPERFPFETYDDLYTNYRFVMLIRNKFIGQHTTTFNLNFTGYNYFTNQQKDYFIISTGIRQSLGKLSTKFEYLIMPDYLIRYYRDPLGTKYIGCEFTEHLFTLKTNLQLNQLDFGAVFGFEIDDYIENFDIYDSKAIRLGPFFDLSSRLIDFRFNYEFKSSDAKGPIPDISYAQHRFGLSPTLKMALPKFSKLKFEYQLKYRTFTTEVSPILDTPHSGRVDIAHEFRGDYEFPVFTNLYISFDYAYEFRKSYSDVYTDIGEYKNYNKWMAGFGLEFLY
ncbi:MAG: hypothetical protein ACPL28_05810 [bacterium]